MKNRYRVLGAAMLLATLISCKKEVEVIPNNQVEVGSSVPTVLQEIFVNKLYISLTGRKPTSDEFDNALKVLAEQSGSEAARVEVIETVMELPDYDNNLFFLLRQEFVEGTDTSYYRGLANTYLGWANDAIAGGNDPSFYLNEYERYYSVYEVPALQANDEIAFDEIFKRLINNRRFYPDIQMDCFNAALDIFRKMFLREPTSDPNPGDDDYVGNEIESATDMICGNEVILFGEYGESLVDFLDIVVESPQYCEGLVDRLFRQYLNRPAESEELNKYTRLYCENRNYKELQIEILKMGEYAGL